MWTFLFSFLLLRRFSKPIRHAFAALMVGLIAVVLIYTAILFLTLEERTSTPHEPTSSSR